MKKILIIANIFLLTSCTPKPLYYNCEMLGVEINGVKEYTIEDGIVTMEMIDGTIGTFAIENDVLICEPIYD